jgi:dCMP deaminase
MTTPEPRPTRDQVLMMTAQTYAARTTCARSSVGAVISREGRILATGYNGSPAGMTHCDHSCDCPNEAKYATVTSRADNPHQVGCRTTRPCIIAVHAEANAIAWAAKHGTATDGAELHTTMSPCYGCAQLIINAGITRVTFARTYRDQSGIRLLENAGVVAVKS